MSDKKLRIFFTIFGFALFLAFWAISRSGEFFAYDNFLYLRSKLNRLDTKSLPITFICIDDLSLKKIRDWPIPRKYYALALNALKEFQARSALFDILFLSPSEDDKNFAFAINNFGKVYLPTAANFQSSTTFDRGKIERLLSINAYGKGIIFIKPDADGKRRKIPLLQLKEGKTKLFNIAFLSALDMLNIMPSQIEIKKNSISFIKEKGLGEISSVNIPIDKNYQMFLDYPGIWEKEFNKIPFSTLIEIYLKKKQGKKLNAKELSAIKKLKNACAIIGVTALGTPDLAPTPLEPRCPMVMTHGVVMASILANRFIRPMPLWVSIIAFFILLLPGITVKHGMKKLWASWSILTILITGITIILFVYCGLYIKMVSAVLSSLSIAMLTSAHMYISSLKEKQRIEYEMFLASDIQKKMLPEKLPEINGYSCEVFFKPAIFVAGDFYDTWVQGNKLHILLGDVSGKGASAALYVSSIITAERVLREDYDPNKPEKLLTRINKYLSKNKISGLYATACFIEVNENGSGKIIDAGHTGIWIYRKAIDSIEEIKGNVKKPLGIDKWEKYMPFDFSLQDGDVLFIFTDGFSEARAGENFVNENELKAWLIENVDMPLCLIDKFIGSFYKGQEQSDDITFFIIRKVKSKKP